MGTGNLLTARSDLPLLFNIYQNTLFKESKELIISILRDYFSQDSYYHFNTDQWGFANVTDHTNQNIEAGIYDNISTRLYIGEKYSYKPTYYPSILVSVASFKSVPLDLSRNKEVVYYQSQIIEDAYGRQKVFFNPSYTIFSGAWEGEINIDIWAKDITARDELTSYIMLAVTDLYFDDFKNAGIVIKPVSAGGFSEIDDRNDKVYKSTVSCLIRSEWERRIPILTVVENVLFCIEFANLAVTPAKIAENLTIKTNLNLTETIFEFPMII